MKNYLSKSFLIKALLLATFFVGINGLQSCGKKEKVVVKSIEEIQKEQGVPVKTLEIKTEDLKLDLKFLSTLEGIRQATVTSMVGDKVEKFPYKVGSAIREGQIVCQFPTDNPALQFEQAKVGYENLAKTYERMKALLAGGETSQQNFDNIETQYLVSKRNYEALKQMLFVEAPISGLLVEKFVEEGNKVKIGDKLFTIAQMDRMRAIFWVNDEELQYIKNGMPVVIEKNGKTYNGKISEVALAQDQMRKAFKIIADFPNPNRELKVGMTVEVKFDYYHNPNAIVIPRSAVTVIGGKNYVYLADGDKAVATEVTLGKSVGENIEVIGGLKTGDKLIYQGVSLISNGTKILVQN